MELAHLMEGRTPLVTNVYVYSAATVLDGAILLAGASAGSAVTDMGAVASALTTSAQADAFMGITQVSSAFASASKENLGQNAQAFRIDTDGIPNRGTTTGGDFMPLCISPEAVYYGTFTSATGAAAASYNVMEFTAGATTNKVIGTAWGTTIGRSNMWLFSLATVSGGAATYSGQLRYVTNSVATTSATLYTAMDTTADTECIATYKPLVKNAVPTAAHNMLGSMALSGASSAAQEEGIQITAMDALITHDAAPTHRLRFHVDNGLNGLTGVKIMQEIVFTDSYLT